MGKTALDSALSSREIIGTYYELLEERGGPVSNWVELVTSEIPSNKEEEIYKFLGMTARMKEYLGARSAKKPTSYELRLKNKVYDDSLHIGVDELRRDNTGQLRVRIGEFVDGGRSIWEELAAGALMAGGADSVGYGLAYDGQFFYDTDHALGETTGMSNKLSVTGVAGSGTLPTVTQFTDAVLGAIVQMMTFKDDEGRPRNQDAKKFLITIPTGFWTVAQKSFSMALTDSGNSNVLKSVMADGFEIKFQPVGWLTSQVKMQTHRIDGRVKPFIRQVEVDLHMVDPPLAEGSEHAHKYREHLYTAEAIGAVGYGRWEYSVETTFAA